MINRIAKEHAQMKRQNDIRRNGPDGGLSLIHI